jgi:hypothetical protein
MHYWFFSVIEIATSFLIVYLAWTWKKEEIIKKDKLQPLSPPKPISGPPDRRAHA